MTETERDSAVLFAFVLIGVMLLVGPFLAAILAAIHPIAWFGTAFVLIVGGLAAGTTGGVRSDSPPRTNCAHCGARVPATEPRCEYCEEPLGNAEPG